MIGLAELQAGVRRALVGGEAGAIEPLLVGGRDGLRRLAVHQRQYETSLITTLLDRFPATVWLVGSAFVTESARRFVRQHPPTRPCIAEYGEGFPAFMATQAAEVPYLRQFSELEWHLGRLSLAVDRPHLIRPDLAAIDAALLPHATVVLQPGVHYSRAEWAIDELIALYLADNAPPRFSLQSGDFWLQLRGTRGELRMNRLTHAGWVFRAALDAREPLADAAVAALEIEASFDSGQALSELVDDGLLVRIDAPREDVVA